MKIAYGTLGWHVDYLKPVISEVKGLDKVVFYYGYVDKNDYKAKTLKTVKDMKLIFDDFSIKYDAIELKNIFDFKSIVKVMRADIERDQNAGHDVMLFDIAGGTKIMVCAALMVSLFKGLPVIYYDDEFRTPVRLPLLGIKHLSSLTLREKEVVKTILDYKGGAELTQTKLAKIVDVEKGTVNPQVLTLVTKGILELAPSKDNRSKVVKTVDGIEILLER